MSIYISSNKTTTLRSSAAYSILLQAPIVLYRHLFCSLASGAKALFNSTLPPGPRPQIWELYSIIGLITAVYSRHINLKEGPHIKTVIWDAAKNIVTSLQVTCVIYLFQFSLKSTQTPKILRVAFSFALQPQIFTIKAKSLLALFFLMKWISWYLFSTNLAPYCFAYIMHLLCAQFSLVQFSAAVFFLYNQVYIVYKSQSYCILIIIKCL